MRTLTPPSCLRDAQLYFAGFSEALNTVTYLHQSLGCAGGGTAPEARFYSCANAGRLRSYSSSSEPAATHEHGREDVCREDLYSRKPFRASCSHRKWGFSVSLHFEWKAFQLSGRDELFRQRILESAAPRGNASNLAVILSGGPHHFSKHKGHTRELYRNVSDRFVWPEEWVQEYLRVPSGSPTRDPSQLVRHNASSTQRCSSHRCVTATAAWCSLLTVARSNNIPLPPCQLQSTAAC